MTGTGTVAFLLLLFKEGEATSCRSGDCTGVIITGGYQTSTDVEVFPENATCTIPPFPQPGKWRHSLSVINDTLVACGGFDTKTEKSCISWKKGQDSWDDFHTLGQERYWHAAVVVDGKDQIIVLGGGPISSSSKTGEIVKSGAQFVLKNNGYATCAVSYQGAVVMIGGGYRPVTHGKVDRYDSKGNYLDSLPDLLEARRWHACTTFTSSNGEEGLLVAGGRRNDDGDLSSTELYLPSKKQWTIGGDLPRAMSGLSAVRLSEHIVVTGGYDDGRNNRNEVLQYQETTGLWSEIGKMKKARHNHAVVAVVDKSLFCAVGCKVEDWSSWSDCSATCGGGTKTRGRGVVQEAEIGGAVCPTLEEEESCNTDQCPVDCEVEDWSSWSECSATCGGGTRTRERKVVQEPENGGAACQDREEEESCKTEPCEGTTDDNSSNDNSDNSATTLTVSWFALAVFFTLFR